MSARGAENTPLNNISLSLSLSHSLYTHAFIQMLHVYENIHRHICIYIYIYNLDISERAGQTPTVILPLTGKF